MKQSNVLNEDQLRPTRPLGYYRGGALLCAGLAFGLAPIIISIKPGGAITLILLASGAGFCILGGFFLWKYDYSVVEEE